ncbi:MAG: hypothetical protein QF449_11390 [Alphaproteobacteria bacterium]|nr:hypothetical protein [Alphaproteobacteria bacterium]MDP6818628.1 hypothetical protein [Alphaproteobacteria bacterium]
MAFDNLDHMSTRDRAGIQHHQKLFDMSDAPNSGKEFGQIIAEAAGLDGDGALAARDSGGFFGADGFGFDDFLDLINPLQHIPIISTIYREITGDTISDGARIFGGALFGGPLGFAAAVGNAAVKQASGKDVGELAMSLFESDSPDAETVTADLLPAPVGSDPDAEVLSRISPAAGAPVRPVSGDAGDGKTVSAASVVGFAGVTPGTKVPDYLDRMSAQQKALLLSSLGLPPESAEQPEPSQNVDKVIERSSAARDLFVRATAEPDDLLAGGGSMASSGKMTSGGSMKWPESAVPPGVDPSSPDWIAQAMTQALDKYENSFNAAGERGDRLDSKI